MKNVILIVALSLSALGAKAGTFNMVEINPNAGYCNDLFTDSNKYVYGAGDLKHFARMNGLLYFVGTDEAYNDELWVTDGTQQGTHKVKEINPNGGAHIGDLRVVGNKLMFFANETTTALSPTDDYDLYVSDGTASGTIKTADLNQPFNNLLADQSAGVANGKLVFCTNTDVIASDGTIAGTKSLASINISSYTGANNGYCEMNGNVYFLVNNDIWKSDGTVSGTVPVKQVADSATNQWPFTFAGPIKAFNGRLYISATTANWMTDLYTFDGTATGAVTKVLDLPNVNTSAGGMTICGGALWFTAYDTLGTGLYKISSSGGSPQRIADMPNMASFGTDKIFYPNDTYTGFNVIDAVTNNRSTVSKTGLSFSGTGFSGFGAAVMQMGDKLIFTAYDSASGQQVMCISDGTDAGTRIVMPAGVTVQHPFDYQPSCGIIDVFDFTYYDNKIVVPANFNNAGRELWFYEESGLVNGIKETDQNTVSLYPNPTADMVTIDLGQDKDLSADMSVQVLDMNGRIAIQRRMEQNKAELSTADLANGSYIALVNKGSETIARRKLVVAH